MATIVSAWHRFESATLRIDRKWLWVGGIIVAIVVAAAIASFFVDEPLRRSIERDANAKLVGYHVRIPRLHFHPFGFSIDFDDLTLVQNAKPAPPVLSIDRLHASVQWKALLRGKLVADFELDHPKLYVDRGHVEREAQSSVPLTDKGWQDAALALYPLKINLVRIFDGEATYVDPTGPFPPLTLTRLEVRAGNVRNVFSPDHVYPSDLWLRADVFGTGRLTIDGHANFLAKPIPGVKSSIDMQNIDLGYFKPILRDYNLVLRKGVLSAKGDIEYGPHVEIANLREARVTGADLDYIHRAQTAGKEAQRRVATVRKGEEVSNAPGVYVKIATLDVTDSTVGYVDEKASPTYRVFLSDTRLTIRNFSNQKSEGTATVDLRGKFMGSGPAVAKARIRAEDTGPDFDLDIGIDHTDMRPLNALWRSKAGIEASAGEFSFYSELKGKNGRVDGYVKPLFRDVKFAGPRPHEPLGTKVKKEIAKVAAKVLKNRPRQQVATKVPISGPLESPSSAIWPAVVNLVHNAFVRAILPGFESQIPPEYRVRPTTPRPSRLAS